MATTGTINSRGDLTITIVDDDLNTRVIREDHPNFDRIMLARQTGEDIMVWLDYDPAAALESLSDRVEIGTDGVLRFDGDPVYNGLSQTIVRYHREDRNTFGLVRFMERLSANPSARSREQLFTWCQDKGLTIDSDGYIIGHKGVRGDLTSVNSGMAHVDGVEFNGHIPNDLGVVVSMPRSMVNDDPNQGCSSGLHVGHWDYAKGWGHTVLEVRIDPADVVSVPRDSGFQKLRCCRYEVIAVHEGEGDLSHYEPESDFDGEAAQDAFDAFVSDAPEGFLSRLKARFKRS